MTSSKRSSAVIDPRTGPSCTEYDPQTGQTIAQVDAAKNRTSYEYYPAGDKNAGQLKQVTNALGKWQRYYYSPRGEQIATRGQTDYPVAYDFNEYGERTGLRTFRTEPQGDMAFPRVINLKAMTKRLILVIILTVLTFLCLVPRQKCVKAYGFELIFPGLHLWEGVPWGRSVSGDQESCHFYWRTHSIIATSDRRVFFDGREILFPDNLLNLRELSATRDTFIARDGNELAHALGFGETVEFSVGKNDFSVHPSGGKGQSNGWIKSGHFSCKIIAPDTLEIWGDRYNVPVDGAVITINGTTIIIRPK